MKEIVLLGDRNSQYVSHQELDAAIIQLPDGIRARWVGTDTRSAARTLDADALWVVPGSPYRNDAAVYAAIEAARASGQRFLATCGGFQYALIEFARNVAGIVAADHAETAASSDSLVVDRLTCSLVGEGRMVTTVPGTRMAALCGDTSFTGFHWCNYGLSATYAQQLVEHGLVISATADDAGVEAIELPGHPFFLATLFQPQVGSLAGRPLHPIIRGFVDGL